jgi:quercetin dioxygenase-like cupin family protein
MLDERMNAIHDPSRRARYGFTPGGNKLIVDIWMEPGGDIPLHFHPSQEERWSVLEGKAKFKIGRRKDEIGPEDGEQVVAPRVKHAIKNQGQQAVHLRAEVRPAGEVQEFLETFAAAARAGLYTRRGIPKSPRSAVRLAELVRRFSDCTVPCSPPRLVQKVTLSPLLLFSRHR